MIVSRETMRVLLLYAIKAAGGVIPADRLLDAVALTDLNFLELTSCFNGLVEDGTVSVEEYEGKRYASIDRKVSDAVEEIKNQAPLSMRKTVTSAVSVEMAKAKKDLSFRTEITETDNGFLLRLLLTGGKNAPLDMTIFLPTLLQAEQIATKFSSDPYEIYGKILHILS